MKYGGCVYIITNQYNRVLYTGVTSELEPEFGSIKQNFIPKVLLPGIIVIKSFGTKVFQELRKL